jgi:hypothetical protein
VSAASEFEGYQAEPTNLIHTLDRSGGALTPQVPPDTDLNQPPPHPRLDACESPPSDPHSNG